MVNINVKQKDLRGCKIGRISKGFCEGGRRLSYDTVSRIQNFEWHSHFRYDQTSAKAFNN
jgi:hypothetical protein